MSSLKRQLNEGIGTESAQSNHKRRKQYTQDDAAVAKIYNDLADEVEEVRLKAASQLIKHISTDTTDSEKAVDTALTRLIKGVSSSRKAARLGFSVALTEVFRIALQGSHSLQQITTRIVKATTVENSTSGQEKRDASLGRQFALQAVLQTGSKSIANASPGDWHSFLDAIADLASQRPWLRRQSAQMLHDFIRSEDSSKLDTDRFQTLVDTWSDKSLWKTPEGVALWLALTNIADIRLPKSIWHHQNPLSSKERSVLAKVMQEVATDNEETQHKAGTRQITPSFAWEVVLYSLMGKDGTKDFVHFWETAVSHGLFATTASNERKALGFQVVTLAFRLAPANVLEHVLSPEIVRCIVNHRSNAERYLFEASKGPLNAVTARSRASPEVSARLLLPLMQHGGVNFDQASKTKTVETLLAQANSAALEDIQSIVQRFIQKPNASDTAHAETQRRNMADLMVATLRSRREESALFNNTSDKQQLSSWVRQLLTTLLSVGFELDSASEYKPALTQSSRSMFKARLMSCLGHLLSFPIELASLGPDLVLSKLQNQRASLREKQSELDLLKRAGNVLKSTSNGATPGLDDDPAASHSLHLLLSMTMLQLYCDEPDSSSVLEDLLMSIESWDSMTESKTVLVEIIISFVSKSSALYKRLAEQVFGAFAASMTSDSLRSMLDILEQKESASGQHELFKQHDEMEQDGHSDEEDALDVEDDSDVELVNGVVTTASDSESEDDSSDEDPSGADDDEEAAFDRKLADALGTTGDDEDEDDDGSDMDDEQMMALEPHLTNIFKERQKQSSTKQDNKDARENIINFKNRILDLLGIYVKIQYSNTAATELIHPLIVLMRTTSSKATSEKAFAVLKQYFDAYSKNKSEPPTGDAEILFSLMSVLHSEVAEGGSKLHTNACSRSSLFVAKLLVTIDMEHYDDIANRYARLQSKWYRTPSSKIQPSMFTEWTSWSITTRKSTNRKG